MRLIEGRSARRQRPACGCPADALQVCGKRQGKRQRMAQGKKPMTQAQLVEAAKVADVLVPTVTDHIDRSVLSQSGERLRLIANFGNGVDNIDVASAVQRGITVTNTPGVLTEDTAD